MDLSEKKILKCYRLIVSKCIRQRLQNFLCILLLGSTYWNFAKKKNIITQKYFFFRTSLLSSATKCLKLLNNSLVLLPTSFNHILSHSGMINTQLHQRPYHIACIAKKTKLTFISRNHRKPTFIYQDVLFSSHDAK